MILASIGLYYEIRLLHHFSVTSVYSNPNILTPVFYPSHRVILLKNEKSTYEGHDDIYSSFLWHFWSAGIESFQTIPIFKKSGENRHIRK